MFKEIKFTKMVASGNDFILVLAHEYFDVSFKTLARKICDRKFGVGADGLLIVHRPRKHAADVQMRIFNSDGSEARMCGNGARCAAFWASIKPLAWKLHSRMINNEVVMSTKAGMIRAEIQADVVKVRLTDPKHLKLDIPVKLHGRTLRVNFVNTGVPHAVVFVSGLDDIDVDTLGRQIRMHPKFQPEGTNVDFVEVTGEKDIRVRTYERGVEGETLACGTGSVASALITGLKIKSMGARPFAVHTRSGEIIKVYFTPGKNTFRDVWLEGKVRIVYKGVYYV
ncbi:MAG: diaminopimelate epimerase [Candidatus Omnitrophica bacterium]|nr:diaminopimelate epimerase [Candidatus Omnitrophota bacterium]